jgi:hypothetical protein
LIREGEEELGRSAGVDLVADNRRVGKIVALRDILELSFDFEEEESNDRS